MERWTSRVIFAWCGILLCVVASRWFGWIGLAAALVVICGTNILIARRRGNLAERGQYAAVLDAENKEKQDLAML